MSRNPSGLFDLNNSDKCVGSYLSKHDLKEILVVEDNDLSKIKFQIIDGIEAIDEQKIRELWGDKKIPNAIQIEKVKSSLDEVILCAIIKKTYPNIQIERQVRVNAVTMDLKLTLEGYNPVFIEFDGPSHFSYSQYGKPKNEPFRKKRMIEDITGFEVVNWAYWIQRCSSNVKTIFDKSVKGFGVLWSTETHFGDFVFENSAQIIDSITKRFNAVDDSGYGYFYGGHTRERNNPPHPIVEKIKQGKEDLGRILPKGHQDKNYWIPEELLKD